MESLLQSTLSEVAKIGETIVLETEKPVENLIENTTSALALKRGGQTVVGGLESTPSEPLGLQPMAYNQFFSRSVPTEKFEVSASRTFMYMYHSFNVVGQLTSDDKPLSHLFKMWRYWKADVVITLQMNAPRGSAGAVLMAALPPGHYVDRDRWCLGNISNMLSVVLDFGRQTEATLKIPYLNYKDMYPTKPSEPDGNLDIAFFNWATYNHPSGAPNTITAMCYIALENLQTSCPRLVPQGLVTPPEVNEKSTRTKFKYTDIKNIVMGSDGSVPLSNAFDVSSNLSIAIAGERVYYRKCGSYKRARDFRDIIRKYAFIIADDLSINNFCHGTWTSANAYNHTLSKASLKVSELGNIGVLAPHFGAYSGSVVFKLTVFSTTMSTGKIALVVSCEPGNDTGDINIAHMSNGVYALLDISAHQEVELVVPYMYNAWCRPCDNNSVFRAYVKVVNPLGNSGPMNSNVYWHVTVKAGDDFEFLWPRDHDFRVQAPIRSWGSEMDLVDPVDRDDMMERTVEPESDYVPMDVAFGANPVAYRHSPVSYTKLSLLLGKMEFYTDHTYSANTSEVHIALNVPKKGALSLIHFYAYWSGEINIVVTNDSNNTLIVRHSYENDGVRIDNNAHIAIPPRRIGSFTAPYYSRDSMRKVINSNNDPLFGNLWFNCGYEQGSFKVFLSLREPNCYYPMPYRKKASNVQILSNLSLHNIGDTEARRMLGGAKVDRGPSGSHILLTDRSWCRDLTQDGDVESNPGPTYALCYKTRGLYKHYGVTNGTHVYHTDTENILASAIDGEAKVKKVPLTQDWVVTGKEFFTQEDPIEGEIIKFSLENNCETWAKDFVHDNSCTQSDVLSMMSFITMVTLGTYVCYDEDVSSALNALYLAIAQDTQSTTVKSIVRFLVRCVCYSIMFCSKPNFMTGTSMATLLFMDYQDMTSRSNKPWVDGFVKAALDGDLNALFENVAEAIEDEGEQREAVSSTIKFAANQGIDDFNKFSMMGKNIEWWIKTIQSLVEWAKSLVQPKDSVKFANFVADNSDKIAKLFTTVQALVDTPVCQRNTPDFRERYEYVNFLLTSYIECCHTYSVSDTLLRNLTAAKNKLSSLKVVNLASMTPNRTEPYGVWISGPPGCGKTFLASLIAARIRKEMGWDKTQVYNHPTGSQYFDSYNGQKIHIIDDLGQNSDEEDLKWICQMISTMHWQVPMADLTEKGTWYSSEVLIATTNKVDWDSKVLTSREALQRRFPLVLHVRAKTQYQTQGKLDLARYFNQVKNGLVWEHEDGTHLNLDQLVDDAVAMIRARSSLVDQWNDFINQAPSTPLAKLMLAFDDTCAFVDAPRLLEPTERFTLQAQLICEKVRKWISKHKVVVYLVGALSLVVGAVSAYKYFSKADRSKEPQDTQVYSGHPTATPKVTKFKKKDIQDQKPINEFSHLHKILSCIDTGNAIVHTLNYGKELLTYGHAEDLLSENDLTFCEKNHRKEIDTIEFTPITVSGKPTDLAVLKVDNRERCSFIRYTSEHIGTQSAIMWYDGSTYTVMSISNVIPIGPSVTVNGTHTHATLQYEAKTGPGSCGGAVITKVGGNWKVIGLHIAGNGFIGRAVDLRSRSQGLHTRIDLGLTPVHMPSKTKLRESPFYGVVPVERGPAVLSGADRRRIPLPITHPFNNIFTKHVGNTFCPDMDRFKDAVDELVVRLTSAIGVHKPVSIYDAVFSLKTPINMSASVGWPYIEEGLKRTDLISYERKWISPRLEQDVKRAYEQLQYGQYESIYLTFLKDELRSTEKIAMGASRVIECAPLVEVILFRMLFGVPFDIICDTPMQDTGLAVGVNPYKDWTPFVNSLYTRNYLFDYKGFDGSLSEDLLCFGTYVLSFLTSEPDRLMNLAASSIWSIHHGPWDYRLDGSMPSGSPFTTLLNSVCNLLLVEYVVESSYIAFAYGDDLVISTNTEIDTEFMATTLKEQFGMTITSHDKSSTIVAQPAEKVVFLKRTPKWVTTCTCVGVLSVPDMLQNIMWCRGEEEFKQQRQSFELELALHGQLEYERVASLLAGRGHDLRPWSVMTRLTHQLIYE
uniref:Genome polyprotein n=1 Tax=Taphozous bat picornavirus TaxID=3141909 RepID=A0AAU7E2K5_9VIRU